MIAWDSGPADAPLPLAAGIRNHSAVFVGNAYARQIFTLPPWNPKWVWGVFYELRWNLFLVKRPRKYVGHNPLAHFRMFFFMRSLASMVVTGFALFSEGAGVGSWQKPFGGVFAIWPKSGNVHTLHHLGMWGPLPFAHGARRGRGTVARQLHRLSSL
jgi:Ni/Fe-hydrogenase 1 B-type cytochrome subunit